MRGVSMLITWLSAVGIVAVIWGIGVLLVHLIGKAVDKAPMMCYYCGHTFTEDEDPSKRCPVCGSY